MGDLNDVPGSLMDQVLGSAGMIDVSRAPRPGVVGNTCCHADNLADPVARFTKRIDYTFARGFGGGAPGLQGPDPSLRRSAVRTDCRPGTSHLAIGPRRDRRDDPHARGPIGCFPAVRGWHRSLAVAPIPAILLYGHIAEDNGSRHEH